jgi:GNAT superfamily N-acetyltransferase
MIYGVISSLRISGGEKVSTNDKSIINIRRMNQNDVDAVLALDRKISVERSLLTEQDIVASQIGGSLDLNFVAQTDNNIVGFIMSRLAYLMIPFTEVCIIQGIVTDPAYQGSGIGSRLVSSLLDYCHTEGINTIRALVPERDKKLQQFIEGQGFLRSNIINYDKKFDS